MSDQARRSLIPMLRRQVIVAAAAAAVRILDRVQDRQPQIQRTHPTLQHMTMLEGKFFDEA